MSDGFLQLRMRSSTRLHEPYKELKPSVANAIDVGATIPLHEPYKELKRTTRYLSIVRDPSIAIDIA
mgnify:CR=1 FL=1